jgi:hypothetical protein
VTGGRGEVDALDFGFVLSRVMGFYGLDYWQVLDTPIRAFWMLSRNIDRLEAERDMRALEGRVVAAGARRETLEAYQARLCEQVGVVAVEKPVFDRQGLLALKELLK